MGTACRGHRRGRYRPAVRRAAGAACGAAYLPGTDIPDTEDTREIYKAVVRYKQAIEQRDADALAHAIRRCCEIKAEVVRQDEREGGLRAIVRERVQETMLVVDLYHEGPFEEALARAGRPPLGGGQRTGARAG